MSRTVLAAVGALLLALVLLSACALQSAAQNGPEPQTFSEAEAVQAVIRAAQAGIVYTQLVGEPGSVYTRYIPGSPPIWRIAIQGVVVNTIPGAPPGIPERQEVHPYLVASVNDETGDVQSIQTFPPSVPPDLAGMVEFDLQRIR